MQTGTFWLTLLLLVSITYLKDACFSVSGVYAKRVRIATKMTAETEIDKDTETKSTVKTEIEGETEKETEKEAEKETEKAIGIIHAEADIEVALQ